MKKRLTAVFLALCLVLSVVTLPVFAASEKEINESSSDLKDCLSTFWRLSNAYLNGDISYDSFVSRGRHALEDYNYKNDDVNSVLEKGFEGLCNSLKGLSYAEMNITVPVIKGFKSFIDTLYEAGGAVQDVVEDGYNLFNSLWDKFCNKNGYTTSYFDMKGYGAVCVITDIYDNTISEYYGDYGIIYDYDRGATIYGDSIYYYSVPRGNYDNVTEKYIDGSAYCYNGAERYSVKYYGNWSYEDETPADDLITDTGESSLSPDELPDDTDLTDFLKDLLEKLMNAFPDTSTIEGLLRAILAKCTSIESRMQEQGGGMTSGEFGTLLDEAILRLTTQNQNDNTLLLEEIIKIREILQGFDGDDVIDGDTANSILSGLISGIVSGLFSLIDIGGDATGEVIDGTSDIVVEFIDVCKDYGTVGVKLLTGTVDIIVLVTKVVPYNIIKTLLLSVFGIMFNETTPVDLTFSIDGTSYTLLSTSFLNIPVVAASLNILKGVVTVIVIFSWLKWARKFYLSLL